MVTNEPTQEYLGCIHATGFLASPDPSQATEGRQNNACSPHGTGGEAENQQGTKTCLGRVGLEPALGLSGGRQQTASTPRCVGGAGGREGATFLLGSGGGYALPALALTQEAPAPCQMQRQAAAVPSPRKACIRVEGSLPQNHQVTLGASLLGLLSLLIWKWGPL